MQFVSPALKITSQLLAVLFLIIFAGYALAETAARFEIDLSPLSVQTSAAEVLFEVEIADTDIERASGLMFRTDFPNNRAMLFDFETTRPVSMWMKNTPLPLDMLFVDENGLIIAIAENTMPQSLDVISSQKPVRFVIEINAGQAAVNGIRTGDKVRHAVIKP